MRVLMGELWDVRSTSASVVGGRRIKSWFATCVANRVRPGRIDLSLGRAQVVGGGRIGSWFGTCVADRVRPGLIDLSQTQGVVTELELMYPDCLVSSVRCEFLTEDLEPLVSWLPRQQRSV